MTSDKTVRPFVEETLVIEQIHSRHEQSAAANASLKPQRLASREKFTVKKLWSRRVDESRKVKLKQQL